MEDWLIALLTSQVTLIVASALRWVDRIVSGKKCIGKDKLKKSMTESYKDKFPEATIEQVSKVVIEQTDSTALQIMGEKQKEQIKKS